MSNAMNKKRLLKLADFLVTVPPERFDLEVWACGAVACAVGWASEVPEFREAGFRLDQFDCPAFEGEEDWEAVAAFFGVDYEQASRLFGKSSYWPHRSGPLDVAARIRSFVESRP
jgi:hypothetical protein